MAITESSIRIGDKAQSLDTSLVTNTRSEQVHREAVVLTDPENFAARAAVISTPVAGEYGGVTRPITGAASVSNNTSTVLAAGATWTGTGEDVTGYGSVVVALKTDQAGTLYMEFSPDGTNWDSSLSFSVAVGVNEVHRLSVTRSHFRARFTNTSGSTQGYFRLQSLFGAQPPLTSALNSTVQTDADSLVTRSVLLGQTDGGTYVNVPVTSEGHLEVAVHSPVLPFGSLHVENLTPVFQIDPIYGINTTEMTATTGNAAGLTDTGVTTGADQLFTAGTGTGAYSYGTLQSRRRLRYRPGQGVVERFTALWPDGRANSAYLIAGIGTAEAGYYFGYAHLASAGLTSTEFGVFHVTGGKREIRTLTLTGNASSSANISIVLNTATAVTVALTSGDTAIASAYKISRGVFPGWTAAQVGATVVFLANDAGSKNGTYTASGAGYLDSPSGPPTTLFTRTLAGVASTDVFYPQSEWNGDKLDGTGPSGVTLDPAKGNVFQIGVQYLGFGPISFQVEVASAGNNPAFVTCHTLPSLNTRTTTHTSQPSFPFTMTAYSAGSTSSLRVQVGSCAGFIEGEQKLIGPRLSFVGTVTSSTSAFTPLFTVRNGITFAGRANQTVSNLLSANGAAKSNTGITTFYLLRNATLSAGTPNFTQYTTSAPIFVDTAATACTIADNNQLVWTGTVSETGDFNFVFSDTSTIQPGETMTLAVRSVTSTAVCVGGLNIREDL
jgi:hypothetical protein